MSREVLGKIESPENSTLQEILEQATRQTKKDLEQTGVQFLDDWVVQKMAYTHYHNWNTDNPRYLFLCQDPGPADKMRHGDYAREIKQLADNHDPLDIVEAHRKIGRNWLLQKNTHFTENFLRRCVKHDLIELQNSWRQYLKDDEFFNDFYMTDIVKYRTQDYDTNHENASFDSFLVPELKSHNFDLIFTFGKTAWQTVRQRLDAKLAYESDEWVNHNKMGQAHGHLYQTNRIVDTFVLPLSHMSGHSYNTFPREEYLNRLDDGLEKLGKLMQ